MLCITFRRLCCGQIYVAAMGSRQDSAEGTLLESAHKFSPSNYSCFRNVINEGNAVERRVGPGSLEMSTLASAFAFISRSTSA